MSIRLRYRGSMPGSETAETTRDEPMLAPTRKKGTTITQASEKYAFSAGPTRRVTMIGTTVTEASQQSAPR